MPLVTRDGSLTDAGQKAMMCAKAAEAARRACITTVTGTSDKSCASMFLSTLCLSDGPPLSAPTVGS